MLPFKKEVRQFVYTADDPTIFYVVPGNLGTGIVEAVVSVLPTRVEPTGDVTTIDSYEVETGIGPLYDVPLLDYVIYRAQSKDDSGANLGRSNIHYQQFAAALGLKIQNDGTLTPATQNNRN